MDEHKIRRLIGHYEDRIVILADVSGKHSLYDAGMREVYGLVVHDLKKLVGD